MESASRQRPLYGFKINQKQAKTPLKSGFSDGLGGVILLIPSYLASYVLHFVTSSFL